MKIIYCQDDCITYDEEGTEDLCDSSIIIEEVATTTNDQILQKVNRLERKIDTILELLMKEKANSESCCRPIMKFKKICNQSQLSEFEMKIVDNNYKSSLFDFVNLKFQNMEKYVRNYRRFAYNVIDTFSRRHLYSEFSWSGKQTRDGKTNLAFQDKIILINFIFGVIQSKMPEFRYSELEDIFNSLCRNKNTHKISTDNIDTSEEST